MQDPPWPATGDADQSAADRLPHFASEVLDYVLEIAVIFLDGGTEVYQLTVEDIAKTFKKSSTQLAATLTRLADDGFLASDVTPLPAKVAGKEMLFPTERALRTLPAFAGMTKLALTRELDKLHDG